MSGLGQNSDKINVPPHIEESLSNLSVEQQSQYRKKYLEAQTVAQTRTDDLITMVDEPFKESFQKVITGGELDESLLQHICEQENLPEEQRSGTAKAYELFNKRSIEDMQRAFKVFTG